MPRRWKRKGQKYFPEIDILLRDAVPTWTEIEGEPDGLKRRKRRRECDGARDDLVRLYRDAQKRGTLHNLDIRIRHSCEQLADQNGGQLPRALNTGRPADEHRRLLIAVHVRESIEARGGKRGSVIAALDEVAKRHALSFDQVRDIYYDPNPEWRRTVEVELNRRTLEAEAG
jgi:hypothetical protein